MASLGLRSSLRSSGDRSNDADLRTLGAGAIQVDREQRLVRLCHLRSPMGPRRVRTHLSHRLRESALGLDRPSEDAIDPRREHRQPRRLLPAAVRPPRHRGGGGRRAFCRSGAPPGCLLRLGRGICLTPCALHPLAGRGADVFPPSRGRDPLTAEKRGEPPGRAWLAAEVLVVFVFGISRLVYRVVFDVRFDTSPTSDFIQYLDAWFVEHDFLRSVLYLHHQAPLQILVAQGCIKLLGMREAAVLLEALYLALGLCLSLALLRILRRLGAPIVLSIVAVSLYGAAPTSVLYESWLFYPLPTATLLAFSLLALLRYYRLGTFGAALVFFSLLGGLALLRA